MFDITNMPAFILAGSAVAVFAAFEVVFAHFALWAFSADYDHHEKWSGRAFDFIGKLGVPALMLVCLTKILILFVAPSREYIGWVVAGLLLGVIGLHMFYRRNPGEYELNAWRNRHMTYDERGRRKQRILDTNKVTEAIINGSPVVLLTPEVRDILADHGLSATSADGSAIWSVEPTKLRVNS